MNPSVFSWCACTGVSREERRGRKKACPASPFVSEISPTYVCEFRTQGHPLFNRLFCWGLLLFCWSLFSVLIISPLYTVNLVLPGETFLN